MKLNKLVYLSVFVAITGMFWPVLKTNAKQVHQPCQQDNQKLPPLKQPAVVIQTIEPQTQAKLSKFITFLHNGWMDKVPIIPNKCMGCPLTAQTETGKKLLIDEVAMRVTITDGSMSYLGTLARSRSGDLYVTKWDDPTSNYGMEFPGVTQLMALVVNEPKEVVCFRFEDDNRGLQFAITREALYLIVQSGGTMNDYFIEISYKGKNNQPLTDETNLWGSKKENTAAFVTVDNEKPMALKIRIVEGGGKEMTYRKWLLPPYTLKEVK